MKIRKQGFIRILAVFIVCQSLWLNFRLKKLIQSSPEYKLKKQQQEIKQQLKKIPEVQIEEKLPQNGELWLKPVKTDLKSDFKLQIWLKSNQPIKKIDLRLFYPPDMLQLSQKDWKSETAGLASWSGVPSNSKTEFLAKEIKFKKLKSGQAKIEFDFTPESHLDCNLWDQQGNDVLEKAKGAEYTISSF